MRVEAGPRPPAEAWRRRHASRQALRVDAEIQREVQHGGRLPDAQGALVATRTNNAFAVRRHSHPPLAFRAVRPQRRIARHAFGRDYLERPAERRLAVLAAADVAVQRAASPQRAERRHRQRRGNPVARHPQRAVAERHHRLGQGRLAQPGAAAVFQAGANVAAETLPAGAQVADPFGRQAADQLGHVRGFHHVARPPKQVDEQRIAGGRMRFVALGGDEEHLRHAGVRRERALRVAGGRDGYDDDVRVVAGEQRPGGPPRNALHERARQHQRHHAARFRLGVREVHEVGRQAGVAVAHRLVELATNLRQPFGHQPLLLRGRAEAGEGRHRNVRHLVVRRSREGRIHDDQVHRCVRQGQILHLHVAAPMRLALAGGKERARLPGRGEVERADGDGARRLGAVADAVGHGVHARVVEDLARMHARQLCRAQVRGGGHDVGGDHRALQHGGVRLAIVAAAVAVAGEQRLVGCHQQGAGAAREVGDAQVRIGVQVRPVQVHPRHRQFAKQLGGFGPGVERGEELPVRDQPLEHAPGEILLRGYAAPGEIARGVHKRVQHLSRGHPGKRQQHVHGQAKDRPIVDLGQNAAPSRLYRHVPPPVRQIQKFGHRRQLVALRDGVLEQQGVGDDRHCHARSLRAGLLVEGFAKADRKVDFAVAGVGLDDCGRVAHAKLENRHALLDQARGHHGLLHAAGDVVQAAAQPTLRRPAVSRGLRAGQYAVAELRGGNAHRQIGLPAPQLGRQANRDHLFDRSAAGRLEPQALGRVALHGAGRRELGFHQDGLAGRRAHHDVRPQRGVLREDAALLRPDGLPPQGMLVSQCLGERGVDSCFGILGHDVAARQGALAASDSSPRDRPPNKGTIPDLGTAAGAPARPKTWRANGAQRRRGRLTRTAQLGMFALVSRRSRRPPGSARRLHDAIVERCARSSP